MREGKWSEPNGSTLAESNWEIVGMPRRRELNGIAGNLLGSLVSRNNDVAGYWAIGKLCALALQTADGEISIELLTQRLTRPSPEFDPMLDHYAAHLVSSLEKRSLPLQLVTAAEVLVSFGGPFKLDPMRSHPRGTVPFRCTVTLTDDLKRRHVAQHSGEVWPHDPRRESKSGRV
jgi:hypothetical protein